MPTFSLFTKGYNYYLHDMKYNDVDNTWTRNFFFANWINQFFSDTILFADYTKDGVDYHVILNPCPGNTVSVPEVAVQDASIDSPEIEATMTFDVNLTGTLRSEIGTESYIHYYTVDGTAEAGTDYIAVDNTLVVPAGATSAEINVTISANASGKFYLILDNAYGAIISDGNATGSIVEEFRLCYADSTANNADAANKCTSIGDFYHSVFQGGVKDCDSSVKIVNMSTADSLLSTQIKKLYKESADNGNCSTAAGTCSGLSAQSVAGFTEYQSGYDYTLGTILADQNITIYDDDTYYSSGDIKDIILYGSYEKDGLHYEDKLNNCSGSGIDIESFKAHVDIVDIIVTPTLDYEGAIKTKISNKPDYTMTAVFLGDHDQVLDAGNSIDTETSNNKFVDMTVIYYLSDDSCTETVRLWTAPTGSTEPVVSIFSDTNSESESNPFVMAYTSNLLSKKITRFKYKAVNLAKMIIDSGIRCSHSSTNGSESGTVTGIPACLTTNSDNGTPAKNYRSVFGNIAFERCWEDIANGQPCLSSSNVNDEDLPDEYATKYGCLECSLGAASYTCSSDAFAIRPNRFSVDNIAEPNFPNLLRSAEDYNMSIYAYDYGTDSGTVGSLDYNQSKTNMEVNESIVLAKDGSTAIMDGNVSWTDDNFDMRDGISISGAVSPEVAGMKFDDVGIVTLTVKDKNWAAVDIDNANDPTDRNCTADGAYICGDRNVTFIPYRFDFEELSITNHAGPTNNFTYIANEIAMMSAKIQTTIRALNKDGDPTKNFRAGSAYYENNISVTPVISYEYNTTVNPTVSLESNESNISNLLIGFGATGPNADANGERTILWNESNDSVSLKFNYPRMINEPANPFDVNGSHLSIRLSSVYTDASTTSSPETIGGSRLGDDNSASDRAACIANFECNVSNADANATFHYARSRASQYFYDDVMDNNISTPIFIDVYCDLWPDSKCNELNVDTINGKTNNNQWWLSWNHNEATGDGNITLEVGSITPASGLGTASVDTDVTIVSEGKDDTIDVTYGSGTKPMLVEIDLDETNPEDTSSWLIYNPNSATIAPSPWVTDKIGSRKVSSEDDSSQ